MSTEPKISKIYRLHVVGKLNVYLLYSTTAAAAVIGDGTESFVQTGQTSHDRSPPTVLNSLRRLFNYDDAFRVVHGGGGWVFEGEKKKRAAATRSLTTDDTCARVSSGDR